MQNKITSYKRVLNCDTTYFIGPSYRRVFCIVIEATQRSWPKLKLPKEEKQPTQSSLIKVPLQWKKNPIPYNWNKQTLIHLFTWPQLIAYIPKHVENPNFAPPERHNRVGGLEECAERCDRLLLLCDCKNCWPFHLKCHPTRSYNRLCYQ